MTNNVQIPTYRAENIYHRELVEGWLSYDPIDDSYWIIKDWRKGGCRDYDDFMNYQDKIDPSTLAIHFPDMLDKDGEKIWAALNADGVGGSSITIEYNGSHWEEVCVISKGAMAYTANSSQYFKGSISTIANVPALWKNNKIVHLKVVGVYGTKEENDK